MQGDFPVREKAKVKGDTKRSRGRPPLPKGLRCEKCNTTDTPEWRVGENGPHTLCNACGLQYAKKKKVEIESKAKHSIKNILNETEDAAAVEAVQKEQQAFQIHSTAYTKTGIPAYHSNKNKRPSALTLSPAGSPMLTRANSGSNFSPMSFAPSSPFSFANSSPSGSSPSSSASTPSVSSPLASFSAMSLNSPTTAPPAPFASATPTTYPRMSPFNPASQHHSTSPAATTVPSPAYAHHHNPQYSPSTSTTTSTNSYSPQTYNSPQSSYNSPTTTTTNPYSSPSPSTSPYALSPSSFSTISSNHEPTSNFQSQYSLAEKTTSPRFISEKPPSSYSPHHPHYSIVDKTGPATLYPSEKSPSHGFPRGEHDKTGTGTGYVGFNNNNTNNFNNNNPNFSSSNNPPIPYQINRVYEGMDFL